MNYIQNAVHYECSRVQTSGPETLQKQIWVTSVILLRHICIWIILQSMFKPYTSYHQDRIHIRQDYHAIRRWMSYLCPRVILHQYILFWHIQDRLLTHANCIWNTVATITKHSLYLSSSRFILCTKLQHSSDYWAVYKVSTTLTLVKAELCLTVQLQFVLP